MSSEMSGFYTRSMKKSKLSAKWAHIDPTPKDHRVVTPDWLYHTAPCSNKNRLAGIKEGILRPDLPTFRRMERDDMTCKLPDEHVRHTTCLSRREFQDPTTPLFVPSAIEMSCFCDFTDMRKRLERQYVKQWDLQAAHAIWKRELAEPSKPAIDVIPPTSHFDRGRYHFEGYALKYTTPVLKDWRYKLSGNVGMDNTGRQQVLIPSLPKTCFRPEHIGRSHRQVSHNAWCPPRRTAQHPDPPAC